jgi:hypothetical protein
LPRSACQRGESNRDPFAEFSEQLVHALMGGTLATSRVQVGHDLVLLNHQKVQRAPCVPPGVEVYALVMFEAFVLTGVLVFPTANCCGTDCQ